MGETGTIDLHLHTTASDGLLDPPALVAEAQRRDVSVLSVTDHDTVAGLDPAADAARRRGIRFVPGIEISTTSAGQEIHILGYFLDPRDGALLSFLEGTRAARIGRLRAIAAKLRDLGIVVDVEPLLASGKPGTVGRPHLARALVREGYVGSFDEAFDLYLAQGRPAYVERPDVAPARAIEVIAAARGIPVLAHPGLYQADGIIPSLVDHGLRGVEVYHAQHTPADIVEYRRVAARFDLLVTGGSDFHGDAGIGAGAGGPTIGTPSLPAADFERLQRAAERLQ